MLLLLYVFTCSDPVISFFAGDVISFIIEHFINISSVSFNVYYIDIVHWGDLLSKLCFNSTKKYSEYTLIKKKLMNT